jgi:hypothetical protein
MVLPPELADNTTADVDAGWGGSETRQMPSAAAVTGAAADAAPAFTDTEAPGVA